MRRVLFILLSLAVGVLFFVLVPGQGTDTTTTAIDEPSTATPQTDGSSGSQLGSDDAVVTGNENLSAHPVAPPNARAAEVDRLADGGRDPAGVHPGARRCGQGQGREKDADL